MAEIVSKLEYAHHLGVKPSAISNYISRKKLTAPALRADGSIDVVIADRQLGINLDLVKSAGRGAGTETAVTPPPAQHHPALPASGEDITASRTLLRARALTATVTAEQARRRLNEERGRYVIAADASAEWAKTLSDIVHSIDRGLVSLATDLALDREQTVRLRGWWRGQRDRIADELAETAAAIPEFSEDVAA